MYRLKLADLLVHQVENAAVAARLIQDRGITINKKRDQYIYRIYLYIG